MSNDEPERKISEADAALEREIRDGRKFTLAEAIGRLAGPGMMKGVSPVSLKQQAEAEIEAYLNSHLADPGGVLAGVLLGKVKQSVLLMENADQPLIVLAAYVQQVLDSEYGLQELVRQTDVEWGQVFGERPYFEKEGRPAAEEDPYTVESVRAALVGLVEKLGAG